jgi:hypothetical protein
MRYLFGLLVIIAGVMAVIYFSPTLPGHTTVVERWDSLQKTINSSWPGGSDHPDDLATTRSLADRVLRPLNEAAPSDADADPEKTIADIRSSVASNQPPSAASINEALNLLHQAEEERKGFVRMVNSAAQTSPLDRVPGHWHSVGQPSKSVDLTAQNRNLRTSFWAQSAKRQWEQRSAAYRQRIKQLLGAANTGQ